MLPAVVFLPCNEVAYGHLENYRPLKAPQHKDPPLCKSYQTLFDHMRKYKRSFHQELFEQTVLSRQIYPLILG